MALGTKTFSQMLQDFAAAAQGVCATLIDFITGSIERAIAEAQAGVALWLQGLILQLLVNTRLSTAVAAAGANNQVTPGGPVATFVADYGLTPIPGVASTGALMLARFSPATSALVPASLVVNGVIQPGGAIIQSLDGTQSVTVIADETQPAYSAAQQGYVIPANTASISATAQNNVAGVNGNVLAGTLTVLQTGISGVDTVTNPNAFGGGANAETNGAIQARFTGTFGNPTGTTAAIQGAITAYNGNLQSTVQITPTQYPAVTVTVDDGSGAIPAATLAGAAAAVASVMADGISYAVIASNKLVATVNASITTATGYNHSSVCAAVVTAIANWIVALGLGNPLEFYSLPAVITAVPGVTGVTFLSVNNAQSNIIPTAQQTIKPGTVTCS